ncbi:MAG: hypothetical protein SFY32_01850 [Bacteroidota bacterium]|nr:hypothetical protein [Bacteroidota bacterium]
MKTKTLQLIKISLCILSLLTLISSCRVNSSSSDPAPATGISYTIALDNSSYLSGQQGIVTYTFANNTGATVFPLVFLYLSNDNTYSSEDVSIGSASLNVYTTTTTLTSKFNLPGNTQTNSYFVIARFYDDKTSSNIVATAPISVTYDASIANSPITILGVTTDATSYTYSSSSSNIYITATINYNNRSSSSIYTNLTYYLSSDDVIDNYDNYLYSSYGSSSSTFASGSSTYTVSSLYPSSSSYSSYSSQVPTGKYYVLVKGTYTNPSTLKTTTITGISTQISITSPPLPVTLNSASLSTGSANSFSSTSSFSMNIYYSYSGTSSSQSIYLYYYLSTDSIFSSNDTYFDYSYVTAYASSSIINDNVTLSNYSTSTINSGTYYVIIKASLSSNNITFNSNDKYLKGPKIIITKAETTVTGITISSSSTLSPQSTLSFNVYVSSNVSMSPTISYYLSSDKTYNSGDFYLGNDYTSGIVGSSILNESFSIPSSIPTGAYYIIASYYPSGSSSTSSTSYVSSNSTVNISTPSSIVLYRYSYNSYGTLDLYIDNSYVSSFSSYSGSNYSSCSSFYSTSGSYYYKYVGTPGSHTYSLKTSSSTVVSSGSFTVTSGTCNALNIY